MVAGWIVGVVCAGGMAGLLARGVARGPDHRLTPASWVTLGRGMVVVGIAALVAASFSHDPPVALIVALAAVALLLDLVDGQLARRTGTVTALGARFDGEVDAFLILALSVFVAPEFGAWVLAIGAARYAFLAGEWLVPWMRAPLPPRRWRKVVAAAQGIVLTVAASGVLPSTLMQALLGAALVSLAASMGQCVWWLWRRRHAVGRATAPARLAPAVTILAALLVWATLVAPNRAAELTVGTFARIPLELLVLLAVAVALPPRPRRALAVLSGAALAAVTLVKVLDMGFFTAFDRPFDPVSDWTYAGIGVETLGDAIGRSEAHLVAAGLVVLVLAIAVLPVLALVRVTRVAAEHRGRVLQAAAVLGVAWIALRLVGAPAASTTAAAVAVGEVRAVQSALLAQEVLERAVADDRFRTTPGDRLLTGLRGKDVLLVFVESYGRVAIEDPAFSPRIGSALDRGEARLGDAGFSARSAFLTSPTFGGLSWLAHSTMQSGVRIGTQRGYGQLVHSDRLTLSQAFKRAGWRAVAAMPANKRGWREGSSFYGYDKVYDRRNVGYRGPEFGLPPMPDQYALAALQRQERAERDRRPLFAEVDLISSHAPWEQIPPLVPWQDVGDGSVFHRHPAAEPDGARAGYARSIEYSLAALLSYVQRYGDDDLVVIALGDHQPASVITGPDASHDVPVSVIARDRKVLDRIAGWRWQDGMRPRPDAPVWPMSAFRDRFLTAFGPDRELP